MIAAFGASHPVGRVGTTAETSTLIVYLCSEAASFITGADLRIDRGLTAQLSLDECIHVSEAKTHCFRVKTYLGHIPKS